MNDITTQLDPNDLPPAAAPVAPSGSGGEPTLDVAGVLAARATNRPDKTLDRTLTERTLSERTLSERTLSERTLGERTLGERTLSEAAYALAGDAAAASPDATVVLSAPPAEPAPPAAPELVAAVAAPPFPSAPAPAHAVCCEPSMVLLDRRNARRGMAATVFVSRDDNEPITRFRVEPPAGPDAPPGLVLYPGRTNDACVRVDLAWLPPYPVPDAGTTDPATTFRVHVDGASASICVRLCRARRGGRPLDRPAVAPAAAAPVAVAEPEAAGAETRPEDVCGVFRAGDLGGTARPPRRRPKPLRRPGSVVGAGVAVCAVAAAGAGLFLHTHRGATSGSASSSGNRIERRREAAPVAFASVSPGLLASNAPPAAGGMTGAADPAPPNRLALAPAVAVVQSIQSWQNADGSNGALWRVAGRNGATFPPLVLDAANRPVTPGALLTGLSTRALRLPVRVALARGLTLRPLEDDAPLVIRNGQVWATARAANGAVRPDQPLRETAAVLRIASPEAATATNVLALRPLNRADQGRRVLAARVSPPVRVGRSLCTLLVWSRGPGGADGSLPAPPLAVLGQNGLRPWAPGDAAQTLVTLPGLVAPQHVVVAARTAGATLPVPAPSQPPR